MVEVNILKKLNEKNRVKLVNFLYSLSSEICFTSFHNYHIDEEIANDALNEYKVRCKDKHRELQDIYDRKEAFLMKILSKLGVKTEEEFNEYKDHIFQSDMALCKKMDEVLEGLVNETKVKDYKEIFNEIKDDIKELEIHMYDSVSVSLMPLDLIICNDTSLAHIAGAMGKPCCVLLPYLYNWRWHQDLSKCDWYDSVKVFCQTNPGNWDSVFDSLYKELIVTMIK